MLIISISFNFSVAKLIINRNSLPLLLAAIAANLALLGWFKYAGLFVGTINSVSGESIAVPDLILPLGISFFTFQQISYLIECRNGKILEH
jgi:alginate O-acetyltransferase complex protein AlgI